MGLYPQGPIVDPNNYETLNATNLRCQRCGTADDTVATHSGVEECKRCWTYRKLDLPAASHWAQVADEFLSNIDMHDMMTYLPQALAGGDRVTDWGTMLRSAQQVMVYSERLLNEGPQHRWVHGPLTEEEAKRAG